MLHALLGCTEFMVCQRSGELRDLLEWQRGVVRWRLSAADLGPVSTHNIVSHIRTDFGSDPGPTNPGCNPGPKFAPNVGSYYAGADASEDTSTNTKSDADAGTGFGFQLGHRNVHHRVLGLLQAELFVAEQGQREQTCALV
mmetsp:Transcript_28949/g.72721  ORF Transcript_28949/g.72721 Transcript_28949/m.72721 type:complete len:141 (-) Transcript_28949:511-933(-)